MATVKSGTLWVKTTDTNEATVADGREAEHTINSGVHSTERKILNVAAYIKNISVDLAGKHIDANTWGYRTDIIDQGIDASKFGKANASGHTNYITDHAIVAGGEGATVHKKNSALDLAGGKIKGATASVKNANSDLSRKAIDSTKSAIDITGQGTKTTVDLTGKDTDPTKSATVTEFDHTKDVIDQGMDGTSSAWDQANDIEEDVSDSGYDTGRNICDAGKDGSVAGSNKVIGDK